MASGCPVVIAAVVILPLLFTRSLVGSLRLSLGGGWTVTRTVLATLLCDSKPRHLSDGLATVIGQRWESSSVDGEAETLLRDSKPRQGRIQTGKKSKGKKKVSAMPQERCAQCGMFRWAANTFRQGKCPCFDECGVRGDDVDALSSMAALGVRCS